MRGRPDEGGEGKRRKPAGNRRQSRQGETHADKAAVRTSEIASLVTVLAVVDVCTEQRREGHD